MDDVQGVTIVRLSNIGKLNVPGKRPASPVAEPDDPTSPNVATDLIQLPRWVVYFQGALLGVVAATFFIFGMLVSSTTQPERQSVETMKSEVVGSVFVRENGAETPDVGAVVILLPYGRQPVERLDPSSLHPARFEPLNNPVIDTIHSLGGGVVRVDRDGRFRLQVDGPQRFSLLVISNDRMQVESRSLTKGQQAELASFFRPVERLIGEREFHFQSVRADQSTVVVSPIKFSL